jgi:hypothetical protein
MKKQNFKPLAIGVNESEKQRFEADLTQFKALVSDFFSEVDKFIQVEDKNAYKGNLINTFVKDFEDKYRAEFSSILTIDKVMELCEVNTDKLKSLAEKIKEYNIEIDYNTGEAETRDFTIYTESEEHNNLYHYVKKITDSIAENPNNHFFYNSDLVRGFNGLVYYDFSTQSIKPNITYILGKQRATY